MYAKTSAEGNWGTEGFHWPCRMHVYTSDNDDIRKRGIKLDMKLSECFKELNEGKFTEAHAALYAKYFDEHIENKDGKEIRSYTYKEDALKKAESRYAGYLVIVTDQTEFSSMDVLEIYRSKNAFSTASFDLKNEQDARMLHTHNATAMNGKIFTLFISAILICEMRRRLSGLNEPWTLDRVRAALDKITFSTVKLSISRKPRELKGLISARQRSYLSRLLQCEEKEAEDKLFAIELT